MSALADLLIPPRCLCCRVVARGGLCERCADELQPDDVAHALDDGIIATAPYVYADPLAVAIKRVKTDGMAEGARSLAAMLAPSVPDGWPVTWVPATARRRRRRGLDLPEVLAGEGARCLLMARPGPDQDGRSAAQRRRNLRHRFEVVDLVSPPARLVLIDDVRTTGATLLAAATTLRHRGVTRVLCLSLTAVPGAPSARRVDG